MIDRREPTGAAVEEPSSVYSVCVEIYPEDRSDGFYYVLEDEQGGKTYYGPHHDSRLRDINMESTRKGYAISGIGGIQVNVNVTNPMERVGFPWDHELP